MNLKKLLVFIVVFTTALSVCMAEEPDAMDFINIIPGQKIPLSLQFPGRCMQGDYDFIKEEVFFSTNLGGAGLFLSTKLLGNKKEDVQTLISNTIPFQNLKDVVKGYSDQPKILNLSLPEADNIPIILSICKGLNGAILCSGKEVWSFDHLIKAYQRNIHLAPGEPRDKIYYKQILHKKGNKLFFPKLTIGDNNFPVLKSYADREFANFTKKAGAMKELEADLNDILTLRSLPIRQENNETLIIRLPVYDQKKCIM